MLESSVCAQDGLAQSSSSEEVPMPLTRRQKRLAEQTAESAPRGQLRQPATREVCCPCLAVRASLLVTPKPVDDHRHRMLS